MWMPFIVIRYFVFFFFCHCVVCHSTINGFWLTLWFLQTFHWYITKLMKSCYYENNQEQIHNTNGVIRIEWQTTQWGEREKRVIRIEWQTTQWGERDKRVIIIEWETTQWGERDKKLSESNDKQRNGEKGTKEQSMIFKILHRINRSSNTKSTNTEGELWCPEIISSSCMLH
jgi:hypothetical protein